MSRIHFEITTPERTTFKDEIDSLTVRTKDGEITILPHHIPLVASLASGELIVRKDGVATPMIVGGGFVEVKRDVPRGVRPSLVGLTPPTSHGDKSMTRVIILADAAERVEEIDVKRAEEARERARKAIEDYRGQDQVKFAEVTAAFERALSRVRIARKHSRGSKTSFEE